MNNESLKKFSQLPKDQRDMLSSPDFLGAIELLEKKYSAKLVMAFIGFIVGDLPEAQLRPYLLNNLKLNVEAAMAVSAKFMELKNKFQMSIKPASPIVKVESPVNELAIAQTPKTTTLSFFQEDEEEIKQLLAVRPLPSGNGYDYAKIAEEIALESGIKMETPELKNRLNNIIIAKVKDIRDDLEAFDVLTKDKISGGLGLSHGEADGLIKMINQKVKSGFVTKEETPVINKSTVLFPVKKPFNGKTTIEVKKNGKIGQVATIKPMLTEKYVPPTPPAPYIPPVKKEEPKIEKIEEKIIEKQEEKKITDLRLREDDRKVPMLQMGEEDGLPVINSSAKDDIIIKPKVIDFTKSPLYKEFQAKKIESANVLTRSEIKTETKSVSAPSPSPQPFPMIDKTVSPAPISKSQRPPMDGVRMQQTLVGPIEELATMTLINFRRLGETPVRAVSKILEKVNLLEKDSYAKRLEGIDAWHKSEVVRFYRILGQTSMTEGRSVDDIITDRIKAGKPTLSVEEFNEIMELNKKLRY